MKYQNENNFIKLYIHQFSFQHTTEYCSQAKKKPLTVISGSGSLRGPLLHTCTALICVRILNYIYLWDC